MRGQKRRGVATRKSVRERIDEIGGEGLRSRGDNFHEYY